MLLPKFAVLEPTTVPEACRMLSEHAYDGAKVLAGGTDLLVDLKSKIIPEHKPRCLDCPSETEKFKEKPELPAYLVWLGRISELYGIEQFEDNTIRIGALTTITELAESELIRKDFTALAEGADSLGSPLVRNRATFGGNIANARPAADTLIPAIALGARLRLASCRGIRNVSVNDFPTGAGTTILYQDEILVAILFDPPSERAGSAYIKLANRKALEISVVGVASYLKLDQSGDLIEDASVCLGSVAPKPVFSENAKNILLGSKPSQKVIEKAAQAVIQEIKPITDHRASESYQREMVLILTKRALSIALKRAKEKHKSSKK